MRKRLLGVALSLAGLGLGQVSVSDADQISFFMATYQETLAGTGTAFTLQVPAKSTKRIYLRIALLECSVNCSIAQDLNGTPATTTALTPVALNSNAAPTATMYRASDAGVGSVLTPITVDAGRQKGVDISYTAFARGAAAAQTYNFRVSAITGTARVTLVWGEK